MATQPILPTINVVPAGFRWSIEAAKKAAEKGAFLRVGGAQVSRRFLSGAKRSWTSLKPDENRTIFHTGYRISGTPEAVQTALQYAGVDAQTIREVLASSINKENYDSTMAPEVNQELDAHKKAKDAKPVAEGYEWEQILWFGQNIKTAVIATKTGEQKGAVTSPGRAGAGESLGEKVRKLAQGKVLDVSNMDYNTGRGVRTTAAPKTAKSGKFGTGRVPIISNDLNKYIRAIQLAYGADGETAYAEDIQVVRNALNNTARAPVVNTGIGLNKIPSPVKPPGTNLAPVPVFTAANTVPKVKTPGPQTFGGNNLPNIPALNTLLQPK